MYEKALKECYSFRDHGRVYLVRHYKAPAAHLPFWWASDSFQNDYSLWCL